MTLKELALRIGARIERADPCAPVTGPAPLNAAGPGQVSFLSNSKYREQALTSRALAVIVEREIPGMAAGALVVKNPYLAWARACECFAPVRDEALPPGLHPTAVVHPTAQLGQGVRLGPWVTIGARTRIGAGTRIHAGVIIEEDCLIGADCEIHPRVVIHYGTRAGDRCILWSGAVLGAYGFGYAPDGPRWVRIHQLGRVVLEDDVDVGANTTVDRGAVGDTVIRRGAKIDNLVQLAHNVEIGEDSAIAAQTGLSGSVKIGKRVKLGGQVGFVGHVSLGDDSFVGAKGGLTKNFPPNSILTGYPARSIMETRRTEAAAARLPEALKKIRELERRLQALEGRATA